MFTSKSFKHILVAAGVVALGLVTTLGMAQSAEARHHGHHGHHRHSHHFISFGHHNPFYIAPGLGYWHSRWHYTPPMPNSMMYRPSTWNTVPPMPPLGIQKQAAPQQQAVSNSEYVPHMRHLATLSAEKRAALEQELVAKNETAEKAETTQQ